MIQFTLKCDRDHRFDSWFQSASAFDTLKSAGHVSCAICGSNAVEKAPMAPRVQASRSKAAAPAQAEETSTAPDKGPLRAAPSQAEKAMSEAATATDAFEQELDEAAGAAGGAGSAAAAASRSNAPLRGPIRPSASS